MNEASRVYLAGDISDCAVRLEEQGFQVAWVKDLAGGTEQLRDERFDMVLMDLALSDERNLGSLLKALKASARIPIVVVADRSKREEAAGAIARGADDYLLRDELDGPLLSRVIRNAIQRHRAGQTGHGDRNLLRTLMEHIPDAIYFKDTSSRFLMISRAHARKFGLSNPANAAGKTDADFFSTAHAEQALADEQRVVQTGEPLVGFEEKETWPDGSITWVSTTKMPLRDSTGRIIGTFGISRDITERKLVQEALAERTLELERKNLQIADELKMARELQLAMLPQKFPSIANGELGRESALEFFSLYHPTGDVSGDFFDVLPLSDTTVGVFICDVMGHDVRAALVTAMMRSLVAEFSATATNPGELLAHVNRGLTSVFKQTGATMFATAFYMVVDVARGELLYSSAAHPDPLRLQRRTGTVEALPTGSGRKKGPALGLFENAQFPTHRCRLEAGDLVTLFTDGLIEAQNLEQEPFSQQQLASAIQRQCQLPTAELFAALILEIQQFSGQPQLDDDVCLVGVEVKRLVEPRD